MRTGRERDVIFYDAKLLAVPEYAPVMSMQGVLIKMRDFIDSSEGVWWSKDRTRKVFIRSIEHAQDWSYAWMLLYSNNGDAPDASFSNLDTDEQRDEEKRDREGRPESCHVFLSTEPNDAHSSRYLMLAEEAPTLSRARIQSYLNFLLRKIRKRFPGDFLHLHPDGSINRSGEANMYKSSISVDLQGHLSDEVREAINCGKLNGLSLETEASAQMAYGESPYIIPKRKSVLLSTRSNWQENPMDSLRDALRLGRHGQFETLRVSFETPDETTHTARLDTATGNVIGDGFLKRVRISNQFGNWREASVAFDPTIQSQMLNLADLPSSRPVARDGGEIEC